MPARRRDFERTFGGFLTLYVFEVRAVMGVWCFSGFRRGENGLPFEMIEQRE